MKIYCNSYFGNAWLLSKSGQEIEVLNHPSETFEFDSIIDVIMDYGSASERHLAKSYIANPSVDKKRELLNIYNNNWCKVRTWGTFNDEVTFRITSNGYNWYRTIIEFLLNHPELKKSTITVESDKSSGVRKTYWNNESYAYVTDSSNEEILSSEIIENSNVI